MLSFCLPLQFFWKSAKRAWFEKNPILVSQRCCKLEHTWSFSEALDWMVGAGETGQGGGAGGRNPGFGGMPPGSPPHLLGVCWAARFCFIEPQGVSLMGIFFAFLNCILLQLISQLRHQSRSHPHILAEQNVFSEFENLTSPDVQFANSLARAVSLTCLFCDDCQRLLLGFLSRARI